MIFSYLFIKFKLITYLFDIFTVAHRYVMYVWEQKDDITTFTADFTTANAAAFVVQ